MASQKSIVLIFGAGANVGAALVRKFTGAGYRVATVSRNAAEPPKPSADGTTLAVRADVSSPEQVTHAFDAVRGAWGSFPSVVVWNVASLTPPPDADNLFSIPLASLDKDIAVMVTSPFVAAGKAVEAWSAAGAEGGNKRFILTGNILPKAVIPVAALTTLGVGKSGAAYWLGAADLLYKEKGWRFFYADERSPEGKPVGNTPGGDSHAELFLRLVEGSVDDLPSYVTFADGKARTFE